MKNIVTEKTCVRCKETKAIECFSKKSGRVNEYQSYCKECVRINSKQHYQENKEIATIPQNNTLQFFSDFENKSQQLFGIDAIVIHRMDYQNNLELNSSYLNYTISNALLKLSIINVLTFCAFE